MIFVRRVPQVASNRAVIPFDVKGIAAYAVLVGVALLVLGIMSVPGICRSESPHWPPDTGSGPAGIGDYYSQELYSPSRNTRIGRR